MKKSRGYTLFLLLFFIFLFFALKFVIVNLNKENYIPTNSENTEINLYSINANDKNSEETDVKLTYENETISGNSSILIVNNRYYVLVNDIEKIIKGNVKIKKTSISVNYGNKQVTINNKGKLFYFNDGKRGILRNDIKEIGLKKYISLYDICKIFELKTTWNHSENTINLYNNREKLQKENQVNVGRVAFIRFEDVSAGVVYLNEDVLEKFRIIGDYLYSQSIPFHIAWVPRYVNPQKNIDNDLLKRNSIENADFIFTFDYLIDRGAIIGLHGYTHQSGNDESVVGTEFSAKINTDEQSIRERIENAISTANKLNFPITFFETPHYRATEFQQSIFEEYFDYIYEPYIGKYNKIPLLSLRNNRTLYIPTPLSYVKGDNGIREMINNIDNNDINQVASLFFHPSKEVDFIKLVKEDDGYHKYSYDPNSILHQIVNELKNKGYRIIGIKDYR